jgi:hypothetical protein
VVELKVAVTARMGSILFRNDDFIRSGNVEDKNE